MKEYNVITVIFKKSGKIADFTFNNDMNFNLKDRVIVEHDKGGFDMGEVFSAPSKKQLDGKDLKRIIRHATDDDYKAFKANIASEKEVFQTAKGVIAESGIPMKLIAVEWTLDRGKITFFYTADDRIDFRQLVKDLARIFHVRIEMRQVNPREAARIIGGLGTCGREFCCSSFSCRVKKMTIKQVSNDKAANPYSMKKIVDKFGGCGLLKCCLMIDKFMAMAEDGSMQENDEEIAITEDDI